ncbi:hypothetical protein CF327_g7458 [Tilletia walkeri]|nr:hypothetical protein CF327_g7458 [Tilletia walkeri]
MESPYDIIISSIVQVDNITKPYERYHGKDVHFSLGINRKLIIFHLGSAYQTQDVYPSCLAQISAGFIARAEPKININTIETSLAPDDIPEGVGPATHAHLRHKQVFLRLHGRKVHSIAQ